MIPYINYFHGKTTLHGLAEISKKSRGLHERFIWLAAFALSIIITIIIIMESWRKYQENPTVVTVERNRHEWVFNMPALVLCNSPTANTRLIKLFIKKTFGKSSNEMQLFYKDYMMAIGNLNITNIQNFIKYKNDKLVPNISLASIYHEVGNIPRTVVFHSFQIDSRITHRMFSLRTEFGHCYATNSALAILANTNEEVDKSDVKLKIYDMSNQQLLIGFSYPRKKLRIFLNSPFELPQLITNYLQYIVDEEHDLYLSSLKLSATVSTPAVKDLSVGQRKCLYRNEKQLILSPLYTPVACRSQCRYLKFMEKCGCNPIIFYNSGKFNDCDVQGLVCFAESMRNSPKQLSQNGCECYSTCDEENYDTLLLYKGRHNKIIPEGVGYIMDSFPIVRFKRDIVFGKLEMLVSFAGTAGLFFGGSILSVVELVYFFTLHAICIFGRREKRKVCPIQFGQIRNILCKKQCMAKLNCLRENNYLFRRVRKYDLSISVDRLHVTSYAPRKRWVDFSRKKGNNRSLSRRTLVLFTRRRIYLMWKTFCASIQEYAEYSTLHGVSYIGQSSLHWFLRFFWLSMWIIFTAAAVLISMSLWETYFHSSVAYEMETDYLKWKATLPAFSICSMGDVDWTLQPCNKIFRNCSVNGINFECCSEIRKMPTDLPNCFSWFSNHLRNDDEVLPLISAFQDVRLTTSFLWVSIPQVISIHGSYEVPLSIGSFYNKALVTVFFGSMDLKIVVTDEVADGDVRNIPVESRGCRFPDETEGLYAFKYYSYSACIAQCRLEKKIELCNCTDAPVGFATSPLCSTEGKECLENVRDQLEYVNPAVERTSGFRCNCPLSCTEQSVEFIYNKASGILNKGEFCEINLQIYLGKTRRRLKVVRGIIDIAVSLGGVFGLFIGASLISLMEIIYFFTIRPLFLYFRRKK